MDPSPSETHKIKVILPRSKVTGANGYAHVYLYLIGSPQAQSGDAGINTMDTAESTKIPRLKVTGPKVCAHAHLPLMGSVQTQIGHVGLNTFNTEKST